MLNKRFQHCFKLGSHRGDELHRPPLSQVINIVGTMIRGMNIKKFLMFIAEAIAQPHEFLFMSEKM